MRSLMFGLFVLLVTPIANAGIVAIDLTGVGSTSTSNAYSGELAFTFNVLQQIEVTSLGAFDSAGDGIKGTVNVDIYTASNLSYGPLPSGTYPFATTAVTPALASASITSADGTSGGTPGYVYHSITAVTLNPGTYVLAASGFGGMDSYLANVGGPSAVATSASAYISGQASGYGSPSGYSGDGWYPQRGDGFAYAAGNFQFTVVPEPSTFSLVSMAGLCSLVGLARRRCHQR